MQADSGHLKKDKVIGEIFVGWEEWGVTESIGTWRIRLGGCVGT